MITIPSSKPARSVPPTADRPGVHRVAAVRARGPSTASAGRSSSRSRPSTRSARSRVVGRGSRWPPWQGRGGSGPTGRLPACRPATSDRASPTPPRAGRPGRRVHLDPRQPRQDRADARARRGGHRDGGGLRRGPRSVEAYATDHPVELLVDGADPRISTGAATLALEVTDAVAAGDPRRPRSVGPGRQRRADQRRRLVAPRGAAGLPGPRRPGRDRLGDGQQLPRRPGIDTDFAATYADGIATRVAIPAAVELLVGRVDEMRTVSEDDLHTAQAILTAELGITIEGAAAASWRALWRVRVPAGPALVIVTGSNVEGTVRSPRHRIAGRARAARGRAAGPRSRRPGAGPGQPDRRAHRLQRGLRPAGAIDLEITLALRPDATTAGSAPALADDRRDATARLDAIGPRGQLD